MYLADAPPPTTMLGNMDDATHFYGEDKIRRDDVKRWGNSWRVPNYQHKEHRNNRKKVYSPSLLAIMFHRPYSKDTVVSQLMFPKAIQYAKSQRTWSAKEAVQEATNGQ